MKPVRIREDAELQRQLLSRVCRSPAWRGRPGRAPGSISVRSDEAVIITTGETGDPYGDPAGQDTVMVDPSDGLPLLGEVEWPPAETPAHLAIHRRLPGCGAVVHTREPHSAALAALAGGARAAAGAVVLVAAGDRYGTCHLPDDAVARLGAPAPGGPAALLVEGTGVFTWGRDLDEALGELERIEELGRPLLPESAGGSGEAGAAREAGEAAG
ncbi:class II aldolase/adducin family protein [Streptomyces sp. LP05-1]|uniref:Class II aldolase/adducin family protein n=1 Tax=Streptomyces pyxinae TaxID=2970734 RepID=A0ABT2C9U0_9ACTN|nr:class II aldolase/adducin family protein [Streptomyces sp. LP05-1]MCS0634116.1 class II aldolase/adducin family protein [Streptomyces sp. LP05-1]